MTRYVTSNGMRTGSKAERDVIDELVKLGYEVHKRGWPDLVATRGREIRFIEIKRDNQTRIKPRQKIISDILYQTCGRHTEMVTPKDMQRFKLLPSEQRKLEEIRK